MAVTDFATRRMQELYAAGPFSRFGTQFAVDGVSWALALVVAVVMRYEFDVVQVAWIPLAFVCVTAVIAQLVAGWIFFLYRGRHPFGSFAEVRSLFWAVLFTASVIGVPTVLFGTEMDVPRSTVLIASPLAFVFMGAMRYLKRLLVERAVIHEDGVQKALIYGAGYLGSTLVRRMRTDRRSPFVPCGADRRRPAQTQCASGRRPGCRVPRNASKGRTRNECNCANRHDRSR
ncbi:nucleoside-diphosphate sugar epimerase/dehydratase [Diaminobutyricimonas sp. LJ205]|uniref:nucleoside-diphosphate sugar epimerase/dehydratase n=1 Tax=Diaminobutyricimonas sp. LJ205 TaxID=2683590 RepID=UPI001E2C7FD1|nr:hypothetical protein [Diaminobutyricimonas sp. LJ205]